jgi:hypothetical protein
MLDVCVCGWRSCLTLWQAFGQPGPEHRGWALALESVCGGWYDGHCVTHALSVWLGSWGSHRGQQQVLVPVQWVHLYLAAVRCSEEQLCTLDSVQAYSFRSRCKSSFEA